MTTFHTSERKHIRFIGCLGAGDRKDFQFISGGPLYLEVYSTQMPSSQGLKFRPNPTHNFMLQLYPNFD